jgi:hypothetical protein
MKYVYPKLIELVPEEEEFLAEPGEEEGLRKEELHPEEEERPRESKTSEKKKPPICKKCGKAHWPFQKCKESKNLIELKAVGRIQITDDEENSFDVQILDDGTPDLLMTIGEREFRFSPEFVSMWRDEVTGILSEEGIKEIALLKLADLDEKDYNELLGKTAEESDEEVDDMEKSIPGEIDRPLKDRPEKEEGEEEFSEKLEELSTELFNKRLAELTSEESAEVHQAYREWQEVGEGKNQPGVRDGTGPAKGSYQRKIKGDVGKRKQAGEKCPKENKENENIEGDNDMDEKKTPKSLHVEAEGLEAKAKKLHKEADDLAKKEREAKEGVNPKKEDSEEKKIKKLAEEEVKEEKIEETDVAKGAKALIKLAKDALKDSDYAKAAEWCTKLAEIEAVVPPEAEEEAKKDTSVEVEDEPKEEDKPEEDVPEDDLDDALQDESKDDELVVDEAKSKEEKDKAKAKKDKEKAKVKKTKEDEKAKAAKEKARKAKAKKESKIRVESTQDITETKGIERLKGLLNMDPIS